MNMKQKKKKQYRKYIKSTYDYSWKSIATENKARNII